MALLIAYFYRRIASANYRADEAVLCDSFVVSLINNVTGKRSIVQLLTRTQRLPIGYFCLRLSSLSLPPCLIWICNHLNDGLNLTVGIDCDTSTLGRHIYQMSTNWIYPSLSI